MNIDIKNYPYKILQITDLHLGFGIFSKKEDEKVKHGIAKTIAQSKPDLIIVTGDFVFPFIPSSGTRNNIKQTQKFADFMDGFRIAYTIVFGNHDVEVGSKGSKQDLARIIQNSKYGFFEEGPDITGLGNFVIELKSNSKTLVSLGLLDSNMYANGWFYGGFDYIKDDQVDWISSELNQIHQKNSDMKAILFFHMPLVEFKEAYEMMKLGDKSIEYNFGSIHEKNEYFGISATRSNLFNKCEQLGFVKAMFCGHDHLNTLSLTYRGILMCYGMSMDYNAYRDIEKYHIQRGGNLIEIDKNGDFEVKMIPLDRVVDDFVRGVKNK